MINKFVFQLIQTDSSNKTNIKEAVDPNYNVKYLNKKTTINYTLNKLKNTCCSWTIGTLYKCTIMYIHNNYHYY